ncbi:hypothetical protein M9H77_16239 [Catharanthus roseus]|uniref:Uncharacterized protein n=1 Tax=Catharanthus roseus TaxID=4058 RepID=A0ACC0B008_CATRO|nr:hypothetical protein M9H77_16239 [Catharanthus roseus]
MNSEKLNNPTNPKKRPLIESESDKLTTLICTVVAVDHTNLYYRVCSVCEKPLPDDIPPSTTHSSSSSFSSTCKYCNLSNRFNAVSSGSKRLFRVLMSVATETKVFVVIMFNRVARVLLGCSADEFFDFAKIHPFAAANAGMVLKGELLRVTLTKPKNGNAQHLRVVSVVPLRSGFHPAIVSLRELYQKKIENEE